MTGETASETLTSGVQQTYSAADATGFDGVIVTSGAETLFERGNSSTLFPAGRPLQILLDAYRWGKPVGALGTASPTVFSTIFRSSINRGDEAFAW